MLGKQFRPDRGGDSMSYPLRGSVSSDNSKGTRRVLRIGGEDVTVPPLELPYAKHG